MLRRLLPVLVAAGSVFVFAPAAGAGVLVSSATDCESADLERPFLPWLDVANYVYAPNGGFEQGASAWTLTGGAGVALGNESYRVAGENDTRSLQLPAGSSATSPAMCVGIEHPTVRFFAKRDGGSLVSAATVEVLFEDALGNVQSVPIGTASGTMTWQPTLPMVVVANLLPLLPGEKTAVAFRFTPVGNSSLRIDDVYVDPWRRG